MSKAEEILREKCRWTQTEIDAERYYELAEVLESYARARVSEWMISQGIATGHGDTLDDLFAELGGEIKRLRAARILREVNNG